MSTILVVRLITPKQGEPYEDDIYVSCVSHFYEAIRVAKHFHPRRNRVKRIEYTAYRYSMHDMDPCARLEDIFARIENYFASMEPCPDTIN